MIEALGRLSFIDHLENYRYIGFGSPYFADFTLFHKNLGITDLVSIEKEVAKKPRFEFNIPFAGIQMHYGESETILPNIELYEKKNIVWLDYDDKISNYMFSDINTFFSNTVPGSFFIISVNVEEDFMKPSENEENKITLKEYRLNELNNRIGKERLPNEFKELNMTTKNLSMVVYEMIRRQIITSLKNRNGNSKDKVSFNQVFNFTYKDNATILTVGGIVFNKAQNVAVKKMTFNKFTFFSNTHESYKIQSPNLTFREIKALDKALPDSLETVNGKFQNKKLQNIPLIPTDIKNYAKVYRYYPNFTEANI